jgi:hypothetical protein
MPHKVHYRTNTKKMTSRSKSVSESGNNLLRSTSEKSMSVQEIKKDELNYTVPIK